MLCEFVLSKLPRLHLDLRMVPSTAASDQVARFQPGAACVALVGDHQLTPLRSTPSAWRPLRRDQQPLVFDRDGFRTSRRRAITISACLAMAARENRPFGVSMSPESRHTLVRGDARKVAEFAAGIGMRVARAQ